MTKSAHARPTTAHKILGSFFWDLPAKMGDQGFNPNSVTGAGGVPSTEKGAAEIRAATRWREIAGVFRQLHRRHQRVLMLAYSTPMHPLRDGLKDADPVMDPETGLMEPAELQQRLKAHMQERRRRIRIELGGEPAMQKLADRAYAEQLTAFAGALAEEPDEEAREAVKQQLAHVAAQQGRAAFAKLVEQELQRAQKQAMARLPVRNAAADITHQLQLWEDLQPVLHRRAQDLRTLLGLVDGPPLADQLEEAARCVMVYLARAQRECAPAVAQLVQEAHDAFTALWGDDEARGAFEHRARSVQFMDRMEGAAA